jgi:hypothetical protein
MRDWYNNTIGVVQICLLVCFKVSNNAIMAETGYQCCFQTLISPVLMLHVGVSTAMDFTEIMSLYVTAA